MKNPQSIEAYDLQFKIDEKFYEIKKRKNHGNKIKSKILNQDKRGLQQIKWNTIKEHILQLQKPPKGLQIVRPPLKNSDLMDVINRIMLLQKSLIQLGNDIANYRRLQMLCIFFQCSLAIVFNAYNLVVFLLQLAYQTDNIPLSLAMLLLFYGYHIISSMTDIIVSVVAYSGVYKSIRQTASKMDELNMYILDGVLNSRISQLSAYVFNNLTSFTLFGLYSIDGSLVASLISGTTTYIIILIQYSGDGEICKTATNLNGTQNVK